MKKAPRTRGSDAAYDSIKDAIGKITGDVELRADPEHSRTTKSASNAARKTGDAKKRT